MSKVPIFGAIRAKESLHLRMKRVYFLLPDGVLKPSGLFTSLEVLEMANRFLTREGSPEFYQIRIVGAGAAQNLKNSLLNISPEEVFTLPPPDLIIIPGVELDNDYGKEKNKQLIQWLVEQYKAGTEIASLCTGTFLLAETGLLKDMECTTHWIAGQDLTARFPDIKLRTDKIVTDCKGLYTAAGATSSLNLMLHLVEKYNGREAAVFCAKVLQIDIERNTQSTFMIFDGQKNHQDDPIKQIQAFIENNVGEKLAVEELASRFAMSKRNLIRRFKNATNNTPNEYIQRIKIEAAKRGLERKDRTVSEIMYSVGYADTKSFRHIFKKVTGLSPVEYRNKYAASPR
jgi:transcriptional regulator GlxA family with amidase domain